MTSLIHPGAGVLNFHVKDPDATIYVGSLDPQADEHILWELFIRCGPIVSVHIPRDKVHRTHPGYAFIEFKLARDSDYACKIMHNIRLYGRQIRVNKADKDQKHDNEEWLVKLFIGNLSSDIDATVLHDIFGRFGPVLSCHVATDPETHESLGYAFLIYPTFESGDAAIQALNGQYIHGKQIAVDYAFIKDGDGRRHGSEAERMIAAKAQENNLVPLESVNLATLEHLGTTTSASTAASTHLAQPSSPATGYHPALTATTTTTATSTTAGTTATTGMTYQSYSTVDTPQVYPPLPAVPPPPPGVPPPPPTAPPVQSYAPHTAAVPPPPGFPQGAAPYMYMAPGQQQYASHYAHAYAYAYPPPGFPPQGPTGAPPPPPPINTPQYYYPPPPT